MNPEAILTPGGIADQLTNGLSGVALAFQRAREQKAKQEQDALDNARADSYMHIAQDNAQTGKNNSVWERMRNDRHDQMAEDKFNAELAQQGRSENREMGLDARRYGIAPQSGEPLQPGMSTLANALGGMSGMPNGGSYLQQRMTESPKFAPQLADYARDEDIKAAKALLPASRSSSGMPMDMRTHNMDLKDRAVRGKELDVLIKFYEDPYAQGEARNENDQPKLDELLKERNMLLSNRFPSYSNPVADPALRQQPQGDYTDHVLGGGQ